MRARSVVVVDVRGEDAAQVALVEDHDVVETLAATARTIRGRISAKPTMPTSVAACSK
jgi:hypothetical protein